jgi:hypothetical protein
LRRFYLDKQLGFYTSSADLQEVDQLSVYQERNELQSEPRTKKSEADFQKTTGTISGWNILSSDCT